MQCNSTTAACLCIFASQHITLPCQLASGYDEKLVSGCDEKLASGCGKIHYFVSIIQTGEAGMIDSVIIIIFIKVANMEDFFTTAISFALNVHGDSFFVPHINQFSCHSSSMASCLPYIDHVPKINLSIPGSFAIYVEVLMLHYSNSNISLATKIY